MSWNPTISVPRLSLLVAPPPLGPRSLIRIASGRWEGPLSMARTAGCGPKATATQRLAVGEGDDQYFRLGRRLEAATSAPARRPHPTRPAQLGPTAGSRRPAAAGGPPAPSTRPPSWPATWAVGWTMVFAECPSGTLRCPPPPPPPERRGGGCKDQTRSGGLPRGSPAHCRAAGRAGQQRSMVILTV